MSKKRPLFIKAKEATSHVTKRLEATKYVSLNLLHLMLFVSTYVHLSYFVHVVHSSLRLFTGRLIVKQWSHRRNIKRRWNNWSRN